MLHGMLGENRVVLSLPAPPTLVPGDKKNYPLAELGEQETSARALHEEDLHLLAEN